MKFKLRGMVFHLLFALGLAFSFSIGGCGSHEDGGTGRTAETVDRGDQKQMEEFLDHILDYFEKLNTENMEADANTRQRALTILARDIRKSEAYHHDEVYGIMISTETKLVFNHARHPGLFGYTFNPDAGNSDVAGTLDALLNSSGTRNCQRYGQNDARVACAARIESGLGKGITVVVGLHHTEDDAAFEPPNCDALGFTLDTSAEDVYNAPTEDNIKAYVKGIIDVTQKTMQSVVTDIINTEGADVIKDPDNFQAKLREKVVGRVPCYGLGDFKHENIYVFIMSSNPAGTVVLNGNDPDLNGLDLEADDNELPYEDKSIAGLFRNELTGGSGEPKAGQSATTCYRWVDPSDNGADEIQNWFEMGSVPGSSPKKSYIEVANLFENYIIPGTSTPLPTSARFLWIFGSGTYPEIDACNYGDGDD